MRIFSMHSQIGFTAFTNWWPTLQTSLQLPPWLPWTHSTVSKARPPNSIFIRKKKPSRISIRSSSALQISWLLHTRPNHASPQVWPRLKIFNLPYRSLVPPPSRSQHLVPPQSRILPTESHHLQSQRVPTCQPPLFRISHALLVLYPPPFRSHKAQIWVQEPLPVLLSQRASGSARWLF